MTKFLAIFSLIIIVLLAFAACGEESTHTPAPAAQAIEAEVQRSVAAALADQSADSIREDAMSTEDMSELVQEAIGAQAPEGISPEQVQSAIERAVSEAPQGLSESALQAAVAEALDQATMASEEPAMMMEAQAAVTPASTPAPTATPAYRAPSTPATTPGSNLLVAGPPVPTPRSPSPCGRCRSHPGRGAIAASRRTPASGPSGPRAPCIPQHRHHRPQGARPGVCPHGTAPAAAAPAAGTPPAGQQSCHGTGPPAGRGPGHRPKGVADPPPCGRPRSGCVASSPSFK